MKSKLLFLALAVSGCPVWASPLTASSLEEIKQAEKNQDFRRAVFLLVSNSKESTPDQTTLKWLKELYKAAGHPEKIKEIQSLDKKAWTEFIAKERSLTDPALSIVQDSESLIVTKKTSPESKIQTPSIFVVKKNDKKYSSYLSQYWWFKTKN